MLRASKQCMKIWMTHFTNSVNHHFNFPFIQWKHLHQDLCSIQPHLFPPPHACSILLFPIWLFQWTAYHPLKNHNLFLLELYSNPGIATCRSCTSLRYCLYLKSVQSSYHRLFWAAISAFIPIKFEKTPPNYVKLSRICFSKLPLRASSNY